MLEISLASAMLETVSSAEICRIELGKKLASSAGTYSQQASVNRLCDVAIKNAVHRYLEYHIVVTLRAAHRRPCGVRRLTAVLRWLPGISTSMRPSPPPQTQWCDPFLSEFSTTGKDGSGQFVETQREKWILAKPAPA